jgi:hypothetical protein
VPIRFAIDPRHRLVVYCVECDATPDEARDFFRAVVSHPSFRTGFDFLGDRLGVGAAPEPTYIYSVAAEVNARAAQLAPCRWAVVVRDLLGFEMARMWSLMAQDSGVQIRPFQRSDEAAEWLGLPEGYSVSERLRLAGALPA